jgi:hypothetical protein
MSYFHGKPDDIRIVNLTLSSEQVMMLYGG